MICRKPILIAGFVASIHGPAHAAEGVVAANLGAMGGAAAAVGNDNAAVTVNPGMLRLYRRYDAHGQFSYGPTQKSQWAASVVDAKTSKLLALGVFYAGDRAEPELLAKDLPGWTLPGVQPPNVKRHHNITMATAVHGWDHRVGVGISGTFSIYQHDRQGAGSTGNIDVGVGGRPTDWLDLGVAARNVVPVNDLGELPLTVVGGYRLHGRPGALVADVEWRDTTADSPFTIAGGGELPLGTMPAFRLGYRYEGPTEMQKLTGGFALRSPEGSLDVGTQVPLGPGQPTLAGTVFLFSVTIIGPEAPDPSGF